MKQAGWCECSKTRNLPAWVCWKDNKAKNVVTATQQQLPTTIAVFWSGWVRNHIGFGYVTGLDWKTWFSQLTITGQCDILTHWLKGHEDEEFPLPSFSCELVLYKAFVYEGWGQLCGTGTHKHIIMSFVEEWSLEMCVWGGGVGWNPVYFCS